jgi:phosphatidylglycerophosphate synthase
METSLLSKSGDGPISLALNRKVSRLISLRLAKRLTPDQATGVMLIIGTFSMLFYAQCYWIAGGIFLQLSSIFSGVDGEIARLRNQCSKWGDFFDTFTDRLVEYLAIIGMTFGLFQVIGTRSLWVGLFFVGMTFLLTTSSEKFRSVTGKNYPKQQFDSYFAWISAGRDARLFVLSIGSFFTVFSPWVLLGFMIGLTVVGYINFFYRIFILKSRLQYS